MITKYLPVVTDAILS